MDLLYHFIMVLQHPEFIKATSGRGLESHLLRDSSIKNNFPNMLSGVNYNVESPCRRIEISSDDFQLFDFLSQKYSRAKELMSSLVNCYSPSKLDLDDPNYKPRKYFGNINNLI